MSSRVMAYAVVLMAVVGGALLLSGLSMIVMGRSPTFGAGLMTVGVLSFGASIHLSGRYPLRSEISRDVRQMQWASAISSMSLASLVFCPMAGSALWEIASGEGLQARWPLLNFGLFSMIVLVQLGWAFQRGSVGDELMRFYVSSAMTWGFGAAVVGLLVLGAVAMTGAQYAVAGIPVVLGLMLFVAGQRLWWQVRRAEND